MFSNVGDDIMLQHCPPWPINPLENKWKPSIEIAPSCPRCASSNTKFCYYNNYSLSQPRYFCKGCRRYWTKGGSLRNVPVGGGCRRSRRTKSTRSLNSASQGSIMANHGTNVDGYDGDHDSLAQGNGATNGPDIDMAVMFAKFLSNDQELAHIGEISTDGSQSATPESVKSDSMMFDQSMNKFDLVQQANFFAGCLTNYDHNNVIIENNQDKQVDSIFELQNSLINNSQMIQLDDLWCDASENESWQPMVQLQDLDSFQELMNTSDNSFNANNNVASDCCFWSSFDLSTSFDDLIN